MNDKILVKKLIDKWRSDKDGCLEEESRLESTDRARHATSIAMLETRAQTLERCILELEAIFPVR